MKFTAKTAGCLGVISFLVISLIFMKGEWGNINYQADFNIPKWTSYFTCIGAMGTAITVIYLAFQLQEMKDARLSQIRPLLFTTKSIYFEVEEFETKSGAGSITGIYPKGYIIDQNQAKLINITNAGLALARDIDFNWEYSIEKVRSLLPPHISMIGTEMPSQKIDFLNKDSSVNIYIPVNYLACCSPSINKCWFANPSDKIEPKPELKLNIKYTDLEGEAHKKIYQVKVDALGSTVYFDFVEIK